MRRSMLIPIACCAVSATIAVVGCRRESESAESKGTDTDGVKSIAEPIALTAKLVIVSNGSSGGAKPEETTGVDSKDMPIAEVPKVVLPEDKELIPGSLRRVMGKDGRTSYGRRYRGTRSLSKDLSRDEVLGLYAMMDRKQTEDPLAVGKLNTIKNEVANALRRQNTVPEDFANNLMAMYFDKSHHVVWRDYCIQHLGGILKRMSDPEQKNKAVAAFWEAATETDSSIAGTSLLAMRHNVDDPLVDQQAVAAKALGYCEDPKCNDRTKITALQVCAELGETKALPTARKIATSNGGTQLRMSAIAAVGTLGDESDRAMLQKYASGSNSRLRQPARSALKRLGKNR